MATPPVGSTPVKEHFVPQQNACIFCNATDKKMMQCSLCHKAKYCDEACQKNDWPVHKKVCHKKPRDTRLKTKATLEYKLSNGRWGMVFTTSSIKAASNHTPEEKVFIDKLAALSPESILDGGDEQQKCKDLGQEIFDYYYSKPIANIESEGNIFQGMHGIKIILEKFIRGCDDGHLRNNDIKRAWIGIGNEQWRWSDID